MHRIDETSSPYRIAVVWGGRRPSLDDDGEKVFVRVALPRCLQVATALHFDKLHGRLWLLLLLLPRCDAIVTRCVRSFRVRTWCNYKIYLVLFIHIRSGLDSSFVLV